MFLSLSTLQAVYTQGETDGGDSYVGGRRELCMKSKRRPQAECWEELRKNRSQHAGEVAQWVTQSLRKHEEQSSDPQNHIKSIR